MIDRTKIMVCCICQESIKPTYLGKDYDGNDAYWYEGNNPEPIEPITNEKGEKVRVDVDQEQTEKDEEVFERNHYSNLAEELPEREVANIGRDLVKSFDTSTEALSELWKEKYARKRITNLVKNDRTNLTETLFYDDVCFMSWPETKEKYLGEVGR